MRVSSGLCLVGLLCTVACSGTDAPRSQRQIDAAGESDDASAPGGDAGCAESSGSGAGCDGAVGDASDAGSAAPTGDGGEDAGGVSPDADGCPDDADKVAPGACGCRVSDADTDEDGTPDCMDACPEDADKNAAGMCGCGVAEVDSDGDTAPDCADECPEHAAQVVAGACGCGEPDADADGVADCVDACPADAHKVEPGFCGCGALDCGCCGDPEWSCSMDTCHDAVGAVLGLAPEAGFIEIAGGPYVSENVQRVAPRQRVWYAFRPADESPEDKPLAIFFNGGPGSATLILYAFNTGYYTLDPDAGGAPFAINPSSWTRFANVLHVDSPGTGFSYSLPTADGEMPDVGIDMDRDAATFVRVLVRFLGRHPELIDNPVIMVGESYGGTRATLMLKHTLFFDRLIDEQSAYRDSDLYDELADHFTKVFPDIALEDLQPRYIARQFSHQLLIQPVVAGSAQWSRQVHDTSVCLPSYDGYQCDEASGWLDTRASAAAQQLATPDVLETLIGVDPTTISWLHASERTGAYGRGAGSAADNTAMAAVFGELGGDDNYYLRSNGSVLVGYPGARHWQDPAIGVDFIYNAYHVHTFITDARFDMVVNSRAIVPALPAYPELIDDALHDTAARAGVERPGWIAVTYSGESFEAPLAREIRFPYYAGAGHAVSVRSPAELLSDAMDWYAGTREPLLPVATPLTALRSRRAEPLVAPQTRAQYIGP